MTILIGNFEKNEFESRLEKYGAAFNGSSDDSGAIQNALNWFYAESNEDTITFPSGMQSSIATGLQLDISKASIDFNGLAIDCVAMGNGTIPLTIGGGDGANAFGQTRKFIRGFRLSGTGKTGTQTAILVAGTSGAAGGPGPSRFKMHQFELSDIGTGWKFGPNSYGLDVSNFEIWHAGTCIYYPDGQPDSGERTVFSHGLLYLSDSCCRIDGNHGNWLHFDHMSYDHCGRIMDVRGKAKAFINMPHIENSDYTIAPIYGTGDGTVIRFAGGEFVVTDPVGGRTMPYIVDENITGNGGVFFDGMDFYGANTTSRYFSTGARTFVNGITARSTDSVPLLLSPQRNCLKDGGFEGAIGDDLICIYKDTASITDPFTGANGSLSYSATSPRSGAKCLKATKVGAAGTSFGFFIAVPIRDMRRRGAFKKYFKTASSGSFSVNPVYAQLRVDGNGVHVNKGTQVSEAQQVKSDASGTWLIAVSSSTSLDTPPEWATHYCLFVDMTSKGAGDVYFDDVEISLM